MLREDAELITSSLQSGCVDKTNVRADETCRSETIFRQRVHSYRLDPCLVDLPTFHRCCLAELRHVTPGL